MSTETVESIVKDQATRRSLKYRNYITALQNLLQSDDPKHKAMVQAANAGLARTKAVAGTTHIDSALTTISVQYKNGDYIAEELMPVATVPHRSDKYFIYDKRSRLAYPDDAIGDRGEANEVQDSRSTAVYACQDFGFKNWVDAELIDNQDAPLNEMVDLVEVINEGIAFRRELRTATVLTTAANYATANKITLAANAQWDSASGGDPIAVLQAAGAALWSGRGASKKVGYCSIGVYNVLARHPAIRELFKFTQNGLASPTQIAGYFGWADLLVSEARQDTANEGQTASYGRLWGNFFGLVRVATRPSIRNAAFGYTMRFGQIETDEWFDISKGRKGGYFARTSVAETPQVVAADTGYLITTPVSTAAANV